MRAALRITFGLSHGHSIPLAEVVRLDIQVFFVRRAEALKVLLDPTISLPIARFMCRRVAKFLVESFPLNAPMHFGNIIQGWNFARRSHISQSGGITSDASAVSARSRSVSRLE